MSKTYPDIGKAFQSNPVGDWKDRFAQWFCEKFGGVADIYCDEATGELVAENYKGKEILRKPFLASDPSVIYDCGSEVPASDYVGPVKFYFNETDMCLYYRMKDGTWYSDGAKVES